MRARADEAGGGHPGGGRWKVRVHGVWLVTLLAGCGGSMPAGPTAGIEVSPAPTLRGADSVLRQEEGGLPFRRILCFGDSVTLGITQRVAGASEEGRAALTTVEGYVPKLSRLLAAEFGEGIDVINSGIGGETTTEGLERIDNEVRRFEPELILLLEGVVDVNTESPRFPVVRANLSEMMRIAKIRGVAIIIGTFPLLNPEGFRTQGYMNVPRLNDIIRQEAKSHGVPIADHEMAQGGDLRGQGPDGLHPNELGYEMMAQTWLEAIEALAASMAGPTE